MATIIRKRDHVAVFKLYKRALFDLQICERARDNGTWGIAAKPPTDDQAKRWQSIRMRFEILEAFLEGRNPNWFFCYHISLDECKRRNESYLK